MSLPKLYDIQEVAEYLGYSAKTILRYAQAGVITGFKIGKGYKFKEEHLLQFLSSREKRGVLCEESQSLESFSINQGSLNHHIGTSAIMTEKEVSASLRGVSLARKTMKQRSSLPHLSLSASGQLQGSQIS